MLSPSDYILHHMANIMRPVMDVGDTCFYDKAYKSTVPSVEQFEKLISALYDFIIVSGDRAFGNMVVYKVTGIKS